MLVLAPLLVLHTSVLWKNEQHKRFSSRMLVRGFIFMAELIDW